MGDVKEREKIGEPDENIDDIARGNDMVSREDRDQFRKDEAGVRS